MDQNRRNLDSFKSLNFPTSPKPASSVPARGGSWNLGPILGPNFLFWPEFGEAKFPNCPFIRHFWAQKGPKSAPLLDLVRGPKGTLKADFGPFMGQNRWNLGSLCEPKFPSLTKTRLERLSSRRSLKFWANFWPKISLFWASSEAQNRVPRPVLGPRGPKTGPPRSLAPGGRPGLVSSGASQGSQLAGSSQLGQRPQPPNWPKLAPKLAQNRAPGGPRPLNLAQFWPKFDPIWGPKFCQKPGPGRPQAPNWAQIWPKFGPKLTQNRAPGGPGPPQPDQIWSKFGLQIWPKIGPRPAQGRPRPKILAKIWAQNFGPGPAQNFAASYAKVLARPSPPARRVRGRRPRTRSATGHRQGGR